jgi:hypothetical protein
MATKMRIYSSLALTAAALFVVPLSSDEAAARGGMGGGGGMRSFGVVRTSPVVISRARTTSVSTVRKQTVSQTKLKNFQAGDKLRNKQVVDKLKNKHEDKLKNKQEDKLKAKLTDRPPTHCNVKVAALGCGGGGGGTPPKQEPPKQDPPKQDPPKQDPPKQDPPKQDPPKQDPPKDSGNDHGGKIEKEHPERVIVERLRPIYPAVGIGVAPAPVAVDPPGCVYERSVRKLPGGGLQRVIVKICPDA